MMANWDKLNKEFDTIINNISDKDWNNWYINIEHQKAVERLEMLIAAKHQAVKIAFNKLLKNTNSLKEWNIKTNDAYLENKISFTEINNVSQAANSDGYPLAA